MAKFVVKQATVLLGHLDVSGLTNNIAFAVAPESAECTTYASPDGWKEYLPGLKGADIPFAGYQDVEVLQPVLFDSMVDDGVAYPLLVSSTRPLAAGDIAFFSRAFLTRFNETRSVGQVYGFDAQLERTAPLIRGPVLDNLSGAETGDGDGLDLGDGVASDERLFLAVFVLASDGTTPTLDLVLESDVDNTFAAPATRITVPQFDGPGSYFGSVDGPITDEWWRLTRTVGGTDTPTFDFVAVIGRA